MWEPSQSPAACGSEVSNVSTSRDSAGTDPCTFRRHAELGTARTFDDAIVDYHRGILSNAHSLSSATTNHWSACRSASDSPDSTSGHYTDIY
jgi:hypothetical protein